MNGTALGSNDIENILNAAEASFKRNNAEEAIVWIRRQVRLLVDKANKEQEERPASHYDPYRE